MSTPTKQTTRQILPKASSAGSNQRLWQIVAGVGALLLIIGVWTYDAVQETLNENITIGLQTILRANIQSLQIVVDDERAYIRSWANDDEVRTLTEQLLSGQDPDYVRRELTKVVENAVTDDEYLGFAIIDGKGVVQVTNKSDIFLDTTLSPVALKLLGPILSAEILFGRPITENALIEKTAGLVNRPLLLHKAPITDAHGNIIAALLFAVDPKKDFTRILSVAELGNTGSTYAFDEKGLMLSASRFKDQLKQLGLIPDTPDGSAILTLELRDPGVDLTKGKKTTEPRDSRPLTRMAAAAVSGLSGIDIDGYRDYRGTEVVGAWQWLPEYGFGVATEVTRSEALRSLRPVRLAFVGLFGLLLITAGFFVVNSYYLNRLQTEIVELRELGQYSLVEKIGEGGMGKVYKAQHSLLKRPTAIKLIREDQLDETALEHFEREVQLTSQLNHPNTISIYDYGHSPDGIFYYAMEYLSGITLDQLIKIEKKIPAERVVYLLKQICGSLVEAHSQGLIHRDIKPGNIMICQRGGDYDFVKVLDFGLVREIVPDPGSNISQEPGIMGSPGFIAPELLVMKSEIDARSDLYSVGAIGFLLLTGERVFPDSDIDVVLHKTVNASPPRPSERTDAQIPKALDDLIHACLSRAPDDRPASASEIVEQLENIELEKSWTVKNAYNWWQEKSDQISMERKVSRIGSSDMSETVMDIDFGERV